MKKSILTAVAVLSVIACTKQETLAPQQKDQLPIELSLSVQTKATDAAYENGDNVGIYVSYESALAASSNYIDNKKFTLSAGKWTSDTEIYWKDKETPADFYCYYPYGAIADATSYSFAVKSDQSALENYKASDFLWGKRSGALPGGGAVAISTSHILSNILIYLKPGEGFTDSEFAAAVKTVKLGNVKTSANVNLNVGSVTAKGDASVITPYWTGECYRAVVIPQSVAADANLIILTVDGVAYTLAREFTFAAKTQHKLTVTVNKSSSGLNISIESWLIDDTEYTGDAK